MDMENDTLLTNQIKLEIESIVFKRLVSHLQNRTDVQNIDLMNLSGFCRNCLSNWYMEASEEKGIKIDKENAREIIYGMPHKIWKDKFQKEATIEQMNKFDEKHK